jgi:hypothetical protein
VSYPAARSKLNSVNVRYSKPPNTTSADIASLQYPKITNKMDKKLSIPTPQTYIRAEKGNINLTLKINFLHSKRPHFISTYNPIN